MRVLITEDSPMYRRVIREILEQFPDVEVVGTAFDGENCLELIKELDPNIITLDINMPRRDGLSTLEELRRRGCRAYVVMVSTPTPHSADQTLHALRKGALDMLLKPTGASLSANRKYLESQLAKQVATVRGLIQSANERRERITALPHSVPSTIAPHPQPTTTLPAATPSAATRFAAPPSPTSLLSGSFDAVCIGVSTGGPSALNTLLSQLPSRPRVPIFIVQHMPPLFTKSLAEHLSGICKFPVQEAQHGDSVLPGVAYVAPGGKQMRIRKVATQTLVEITEEGYVSAAKPSVDYLFHSIATVYGKRTLGLILTGMGSDGLDGCRKLFHLGAHILAQSEETCVVYGMPRQVIENRVASEIVPLPSMAARVTELLRM